MKTFSAALSMAVLALMSLTARSQQSRLSKASASFSGSTRLHGGSRRS
jgi:hypothetical protein